MYQTFVIEWFPPFENRRNLGQSSMEECMLLIF